MGIERICMGVDVVLDRSTSLDRICMSMVYNDNRSRSRSRAVDQSESGRSNGGRHEIERKAC